MILERVVQILISSIVFSIVCFLIQNRKLYFREYNISYTEEQFQVALKKTAHELDWTIESNKKGSTRASRSSNWSGSWGEMITIIKRDNQILLNSICDPNLKSSVISWGWNNRNRKSFISNLQIATGQNK